MMVLDLVPRFELEPKDEPGNDYPNNAYYGDWNKGFQYFKFNKKSKKKRTVVKQTQLIIFLIFMI